MIVNLVRDGNICGIFGEDEENNLVEMGSLIDIEEAYGNAEWVND